MAEKQLVSLVFIIFGGLQFFYPEEVFKFRAWVYKKIYDAKVEGSKRTYKIYQVVGILFAIIGIGILFA